jgi:hypothetical protein
MMNFIKRLLLWGVGLALFVVAERAFGMVWAFVAAGVCFVGYVAYVSLRETVAESEEDDS